MENELIIFFNQSKEKLNNRLFNKTKLTFNENSYGACYFAYKNEITIPPSWIALYDVEILKAILAHEIGHVVLNTSPKNDLHLANKQTAQSINKHFLKINILGLLWGALFSFCLIFCLKTIENTIIKSLIMLAFIFLPVMIFLSFYYIISRPLIVKILKPKSHKFKLAEKIQHRSEYQCDLFACWLVGDNTGLVAFLEGIKYYDTIESKNIANSSHPSPKERIQNILCLKMRKKIIKKIYKLNLIKS